MIKSLPRTAVVAGATALAIATALALAATFSAGSGRAAQESAPGAFEPGSSFAVFAAREARAQAPDEAALGKEIVASLGLPDAMAPDPSTLRLARMLPTGERVWVFRGRSIVCFAVRGQSSVDRSLGCSGIRNDVDPSKKAPVSVSAAGPDGGLVVALVGDGVDRLTLTSVTGATVLTPDANIVSGRVAAGPSSLSWQNPDGSSERIQFNRTP